MKEITLEWEGKGLSNNEFYRSDHWKKRYEHTKRWHKYFGTMLLFNRKLIPKIVTKYRLHLKYNSKIDPSNTIAMIKVFEDTMQKMDIVLNDDKRFCKCITLEPDIKMKNNTYILHVQFN